MKTKKTELDVDFIGGQSTLTAAEEKALSNFFKQRKMSSADTPTKQRRGSSGHQKVHA